MNSTKAAPWCDWPVSMVMSTSRAGLSSSRNTRSPDRYRLGLAEVDVGGKSALIDLEGKEVLAPRFAGADSVHQIRLLGE